MKHLLLLLLILLWSVYPAFTQVQTMPKASPPVHVKTPGHPSTAEEAFYEATLSATDPTYWIQDSSWYSPWKTATSEWYLNEKNFNIRNGSGQVVENLYTILNEVTLDWENLTRYVYEYTGNGNYRTITEELWNDADLHWEMVLHYHYDDLGRMDTVIYKNYDRVNHIFTSGSRTVYTFNTANMYLVSSNENLDTATGTWINYSKINYTYTDDIHLVTMLSQMWDAGLSDWVNDMKTEYSYDVTWVPTGHLTSVWATPGNVWENFSLTTITNNPGGNPVEELLQYWDGSVLDWYNSERLTYQYDANDRKSEVLVEQWDLVLMVWNSYEKQTFTYHPNGQMQDNQSYRWNPFGMIFMDVSDYSFDSIGYYLSYYYKYLDPDYQYTGGYRYSYTYNALHQTDELLGQDLDGPSNTWIDRSKRLYTYDGNNNNTVELDLAWDTGLNDWVNSYKMEHFYSDFIGIGEPKAVTDYCFFSNPLERGETINCPALQPGKSYQLTLLNLNGQAVASTTIRAGESYQVPQDLSAGMYLMQLCERGMIVATGKMIVSK
jgi:hypothetical protein